MATVNCRLLVVQSGAMMTEHVYLLTQVEKEEIKCRQWSEWEEYIVYLTSYHQQDIAVVIR